MSMTVTLRLLVCALIWNVLTLAALGQGYIFNVGAGPGFPLSPTSDLSHTFYNLVVGGGPNISSHVKMNAEFMFKGLPVNENIIKETRLSDVLGRLYSLTGNFIVEGGSGGKNAYIIGGGG